MLSRADLNIITREFAIPGLPLLLDIQLLSARLGINLRKQTYLNYKPGTSCTISVVDDAGEAYAVMAYPRDRFEEVCVRSEWFSGPVRATVLKDVCVVMVPMPLDRRIKATRVFAQPESRERFFRKLLRHLPQDGPVDAVLLRYKPRRRIVARLHVAGLPIAVIKCFDPQGFDNALLGSQLCSQVSGVKRTGIDHRRYAIATEWINGPSLCPHLSGELHSEAFRETGQWLAGLHVYPPETSLPLFRETQSSLMNPLLAIANDFSTLAPQLAATMHRLVDQINDACTRTQLLPTLIHGDFSADQVIVARNSATDEEARQCHPVVIDWDRAMMGNPLRDVGSFLARLDHQSMDGTLDMSITRCAQQEFLSGYAAHLPHPDLRLVNAFHARALLLLITEGFRHRHADWFTQAQMLLGKVDALMRPPTPSTHHTHCADTSPMLTAALDVDKIRGLLASLVASGSEHLIMQSAALLRHKPGRRALIRYEGQLVNRQLVSRRFTALGKLRFRKPDLQTPALHDRLRAYGLDERNPQEVSIPASLGVYPDAHLWFQELVPGKELSQYLDTDHDTEPFRQTGKALACFHATPVTSSRQWSLADEANVLERALKQAIEVRTDLDHRIRALRDTSMRAFDSLETVAPQLIHRDFYHDQVLIDGKRVWIVDLDLSAQGDPAIDVGNFLAHIREYSIRRYACTTALNSLSMAFLEGYFSQGSVVDTRRILLLESLSLARHLLISTTFEDRRHTTELLLAHCEGQLAALTSNAAGRDAGTTEMSNLLSHEPLHAFHFVRWRQGRLRD